jgi:rhodanese-related sulfurtransferase
MNASPPAPPYQPLSVEELVQWLADSNSAVQLVDVREPAELALAQLPGFLNLPLSQFNDWGTDIDHHLEADQPTVVICHHGVRSAQMCQRLSQQGFSQLYNLTGGIDAYALVDPTIPRY